MARKVYHVTPTANGWQGKLEGAERASVIGGTKERVVEETIALAKRNMPSSVRIHLADGRFEEERTYGDDPYPPPG